MTAAAMSETSTAPTAVGTFLRVLMSGYVLAIAIGFPAIGAASDLSQPGFGVGSLVKATISSAIGAGICVLCIRTVVRQIWTAWVGLLSGVIPTSLAAPRALLVRLALAHLGAGVLLVASGLRLLDIGADAASPTWAFFGATSLLVGFGLGLGGALPRLWWAWRGGGVEQPDDTVSRHLHWFAWLALTALSLSSGLAETLPSQLDPEAGVPLRRGSWERGCATDNALVQDICPRERRYLLHTRRPGRMRVEWQFSSSSCELTIDDGSLRRTYARHDGPVRLDVDPGPAVEIVVVGLDTDGCHFEVRARPEPEDQG